MMPDVETNSAIIIQNKRKTLGMTQREFAELLGLKDTSERTVRCWERGEHRPSAKKLSDIISLKTEIPFINKRKTHTFSFVDLFAGIGGIRIPFQKLGGKCVFTSEWDRFAKKTYAVNFGELPQGDITAISTSDIPDHDILLAGFPCQAFSQAGHKHGFFDTRGTMFFEIQRILAAKRPKAFLLENVKQLKGHNRGDTLDTILKILKGENTRQIPKEVPMSEEAREHLNTNLNYAVNYRVLRSDNFGVPQKRERIYLVGFDRSHFSGIDIEKQLISLFDMLANKKTETCLGNILEANSRVPEKYTISDRLYAGHKRRKIEHKMKGNGFGFSVFNRESKYCNTISARYYKDGSEILIDQTDILKNPRKLTPRECARIQGFPEEFIVNAVSDGQIYKQFGNSVSVPVVTEIAEGIVDILRENTVNDTV